ncbi:uncharacterized protein LOC121854545 [Homarus americanus]|uniref:Lethal(2)essential for life-like 4 n=1 Tax=Homarus americanus TaxID=6706 RepID=A0A8J5MLH7_HOMAM|nr:uncharacterized protein LOC121854545 [Homarus americanus]KAG7155781.1 lethal(2)essential for life-like 4 [Homarus americanus]
MSLASTLLGDLKGGFRLPITRRGAFLQDDFFSGFQKDYSRAVGDVLDRWGSRSSKADRFASYRKLRERDASEDSQAATISETTDNYVIVLDMNEYSSGEITVQTVGFSALVEGKVANRTYKRSFPLPKNTIIDRVVADLSDENILTITAKRKGKGVAINVDSTDDAARSATSSQQQSSADVTSIESQIIPTEAEKTQTSSSATTEERVIPTVRDGGNTNTSRTVKTEAMASSGTRKGSSSRIIPLNIEGETIASQTVDEADSAATQTSATSSTAEKIIPTVREGGATQAASTSTTYSSSTQNRVLPINRRGRFFQDSTFENVWDDFESAIDELMSRRGSRSGQEEDKFQSYRNLRQCVQQDDNQAATVSTGNGEYKVVVDVKDFVDGHLDVKAEKGAIVVVGKKGTCSFERRFSIPGLSQPDLVAAALSADGVLTITAPK